MPVFVFVQHFLINASPDRNTKGAGAQKPLDVNYHTTPHPNLSPYVTKGQLIFYPCSLLHMPPVKPFQKYTPQKRKGTGSPKIFMAINIVL